MERSVEDLLDKGFIRPGISPFVEPALFKRRKMILSEYALIIES